MLHKVRIFLAILKQTTNREYDRQTDRNRQTETDRQTDSHRNITSQIELA